MSKRLFGWLTSLFNDDIDAADPLAVTGFADVAGSTVNVDGTPMMPGGVFDVLGKVFGDSGGIFGSDFGGDTFGTDMASSNFGGTD
jgi:hypothetical protein